MLEEGRLPSGDLRVLVDSIYEREPTPDNPIFRLVRDELPLDECRDFYLSLRDSLEVFNRVLLPRLLAEAPTPEIRRELLPVISVEFGPRVEVAHPTFFERFLISLGVPPAAARASADVESTCREEVEHIRSMSFCELLARILVGETQGPMSFPIIAAALQRNYGLSSRDVYYFTLHAVHDKKDTEILFGMLEKHASSKEDRERVVRTLERSFNEGRYRHNACRLEPAPLYSFVAPARGAASSDPPDPRAAGDSTPPPAPRTSNRGAQPLPMENWLNGCWAALEGQLTSRATRLGSLLSHQLSGAELTSLWRELAPTLYAQEALVGAELLEHCPDLKTRVALFGVLRPRFGYDERRPSHGELLERFLSAVGAGPVPREQRSPALARPRDLRQLFAVGLFAPMLLGRFVFPAVRRALASEPHRLSTEQLAYFDAVIENANAALSVSCDVAMSYFTSEEERRTASAAIADYLSAFMDGHAVRSAQTSSEMSLSEETAALGPEQFEQELRSLCDRVYEVDGPSDNPVLRLLRGQLTREEAREFWGSRWNRMLVLTRHILPNLLRHCPDFESAVALFRSISVEYGNGDLRESHPVLFRRLLCALGVSDDICKMALQSGDPITDGEIQRLERLEFRELLGEFLARETVGPKTFGLVADQLRAQFGLTDADVAWFTVHAAQDQQDADDMFALARKFGKTREDQQVIRSAMLGWFRRNPWYCCKLGAAPVHFAAPPAQSTAATSAQRKVRATAAARFQEACVKCGKTFAKNTFNTKCDACGGMVDVNYDLSQVAIYPNESATIDRYRDILPVADPAKILRVGAGNTPCVHARALGKRIGLSNLFLKDESKNPTGTVKDRPAEVVLSYLGERKIFHFTSSATGNSSTAFARACIAHPPFEHSIFVGERWLSRLTFDANPRVHVWVLEGEVSSVEAIAFSRVWEKANNVPPEGGFFNLGRREGLKLAFLEATDQLETTLDWYVQGVSTAMGAYGTFKAASQYLGLGRIKHLPRMALAQETTCCPQVNAFSEGSPEVLPHHIVKNPDGIADALLKGNPSDTYPYIYGMLQKTGGTFVPVTADEIRTARREILEYEGINACNASATTIAAIKRLVRSGQMGPNDKVLATLTGSDRDPAQHVKEYTRVVRGPDGWAPVAPQRR